MAVSLARSLRLALPALVGGLLLLSGCNSPRTTAMLKDMTQQAVRTGDWDTAVGAVNDLYGSYQAGEPEEPGGRIANDLRIRPKHELLWRMERGLIAFLAGDYDESRDLLDDASRLVEELRATSVSEAIGQWIVNDTIRTYEGRLYEHTYVPYYVALGHVMQAQRAAGTWAPPGAPIPQDVPPPVITRQETTEDTMDLNAMNQAADAALQVFEADSGQPPSTPPDTIVYPPLRPVDAEAARSHYRAATNAVRGMTQYVLPAAEQFSRRRDHYIDDAHARMIAALVAMADRDRTESDRQYANAMLRAALDTFEFQFGRFSGERAYRYEVSSTPQIAERMYLRNLYHYSPADYRREVERRYPNLDASDYASHPWALPENHGMVVVINDIGYVARIHALQIILITGLTEQQRQQQDRRNAGDSHTFGIGTLTFRAYGPGAAQAQRWTTIPLPANVVADALAPGGASIIGFQIPVHAPDQPVPAPGSIMATSGGGTIHTALERTNDVDAFARATLKDAQPGVLLRTLARSAARQAAAATAANEARNEHGEVAGLLTNLFGSAIATVLEQADLRHWTLLPNRTEVGVLDLPAGHWTLTLHHQGQTQYLGTVNVTPGEIIVIPTRSFSPNGLP